MIHLIYLAAGASCRFGADKLLADYGRKPLFAHGLQTLAAAAAGRSDADLTVVTNTPAIAAAARAVGAAAVSSPQSALGQSYSIRAGLEAVGPLAAGISFSLRWPTSHGCAPKRSRASWPWPGPAPGRRLPPVGTGWATRACSAPRWRPLCETCRGTAAAALC